MTQTQNEIFGFYFPELGIKGQWVRLTSAFTEVLQQQEHQPIVRTHLGQLMALSCLLANSIKIEGRLTLQAQGSGPLSVLMAEATSDIHIRATSCWRSEPTEKNELADLIGEGYLAITYEPKDRKSHQSLVQINGDDWAECLGNYFQQSEQLATQFWLSCTEDSTTGLMLQRMPAIDDESAAEAAWEHLQILTNTLSQEELASLSAEQLLYRLYGMEEVQVHPIKPITYQCTCSRERTEVALRAMGANELELMIAEEGECKASCKFCQQSYVFSKTDLQTLLKSLVRPH